MSPSTVARVPATAWAASAALALSLAACSAPPAIPAVDRLDHRLVVAPTDGVSARRTAALRARWRPPATVIVTNGGRHGFCWQLEAEAPWLGAGGERSGILAPGASLVLKPTIDVMRAPQGTGWHDSSLRVLNALTFHCEASIPVGWRVENPPSPSAGAELQIDAAPMPPELRQ